MKLYMVILLLVTALCLPLIACKDNTEDMPDVSKLPVSSGKRTGSDVQIDGMLLSTGLGEGEAVAKLDESPDRAIRRSTKPVVQTGVHPEEAGYGNHGGGNPYLPSNPNNTGSAPHRMSSTGTTGALTAMRSWAMTGGMLWMRTGSWRTGRIMKTAAMKCGTRRPSVTISMTPLMAPLAVWMPPLKPAIS